MFDVLAANKSRFLALGGAIGTGLFVGSGAILSLVGPAPLFMAYLSMSILTLNDDHRSDKLMSE